MVKRWLILKSPSTTNGEERRLPPICSLLHSKGVVALRVSTKKAPNVKLNDPQVAGSKDENGHSHFVPLAEKHP